MVNSTAKTQSTQRKNKQRTKKYICVYLNPTPNPKNILSHKVFSPISQDEVTLSPNWR